MKNMDKKEFKMKRRIKSAQSILWVLLLILSACKAEEGSGVVPPLTDDNAADGKIGSAVRIISGRMGL